MYNCPVRWHTVYSRRDVCRRSVVDEMSVDELSWNPPRVRHYIRHPNILAPPYPFPQIPTRTALDDNGKKFLCFNRSWIAKIIFLLSRSLVDYSNTLCK